MRVKYRESFYKDADKVPSGTIRDELIHGIKDLQEAENITDLLAYYPVKKLRGYPYYYRLQVEKYRLTFKLENDNSITLIRFLHRSEIYNKFP